MFTMKSCKFFVAGVKRTSVYVSRGFRFQVDHAAVLRPLGLNIPHFERYIHVLFVFTDGCNFFLAQFDEFLRQPAFLVEFISQNRQISQFTEA